jgi:hypothetical protein
LTTNVNSMTDGAANQAELVAGFTLSEFPAFEVCENLNVHGRIDWYLPARNEVELMLKNRDAIGGFTITPFNYYSSSTEDILASSSTHAHTWMSNTDTVDISLKVATKRVRCARQASTFSTVANTKSSGAAWTALSGVTLNTNDALLLCISSLNAVTSVTWNGAPLALDATAGSTPLVYIYSLSGATAGTGNLVINGTTGAKAVTAMTVKNLATSSQLDKQAAQGPITSTTPSSGATATTTQNNELLFGCVATNGPVENAEGYWGDPFKNYGLRDGTTGAGAASNVTASSHWLVVSATGAYAASKTGITSRPWSAAIATYKAAISGGSGSCSNPTGVEGAMLYNTDYNKVQFCNGSAWAAFGE